MKIHFSRIISWMLTLMMIASTLSTAVFSADFTKLKATDGEVTLDGTNPGIVTVYWTGTGEQNIYAIEGSWSLKETGSTTYLTLTAMGSEVLTFTGMNYVDVPTGKVVWTDDSFSNPGVVSNGKQLLSATYEVAADTPAGTYTVQYSSALLVGDDYENDKTAVKAEPKIVVKRSGGSGETHPEKPTIAVTGTYTYNGSNQTATVTGYDSATMNISGDVQKNAGNYTVSVTSKTGKWADGSTAAVTAAWSIAKAEPSYTVPTGLTGEKGKALSTVTLPTGWTWKTPATVMNTTGNQSFKAVFTPTDTANYKTVEKDVTVTVNETITHPAKPTISVTGTYTYNGSEQTAAVTGYNSATMNLTGNVQKNAGNYTVSVTSKTGKWADGSTTAVTAAWSIAKAEPSYTVPTGLTGEKGKALSTVTLPTGWIWKTSATVMNTTGNQSFKAVFTPADTANYKAVEKDVTVTVNETITHPAKPTISVTGTYTYTGSEQTAAVTGYNSATMNLTGNKGTTAGNYTVSVTSKTGKWADGSTAAVTASWNIEKATPSGIPKYTAISEGGKTLAEAGLTVTGGSFSIAGTVKWVADDGITELSGTTAVVANTYYKWLFTPTDTGNYKTFSGAIKLYNTSSGEREGAIRYTVTFETNGGSKMAAQSVVRNTSMKEPTPPTKENYAFEGWYINKELTKAYDFDTKVTSSFTLYANWTEKEIEPEKPVQPDPPVTPSWKNPFSDIKNTDWYYENVKYAVENSLMVGTTTSTFAPNGKITRAMFVTVLYRTEGQPAVSKNVPFDDVKADSYYANAVIWAQQNGIVSGVSESEFAPDRNITREQIAAIIYRYAKYKGYDISAGEHTNILSYADFSNISEYAINAMQYAVGSNLIKGKTESTLNPKDNATRAEIAAILNRFIEGNK